MNVDVNIMRINFIIFYYIFYVEIRITSSTLNVHKPQSTKLYHGRFTRDVVNPELLIPRHAYANGTFKSFHLSNYYNRQEMDKRKRSINNISDKLHLILPFDKKHHHIELTPYYDFISPEMVIEVRGESSKNDLDQHLKFKRASDDQCHYRGLVRGHENSRVVLSLCDGVAGYIVIDNKRYFIEPIDNSQPGEIGQHAHMIYKREADHEKEMKHSCGTSDDWESAWTEQLNKRERRLLADDAAGLKRTEQIKSSTHSIHRYIEVGLVADKKFLEFHKEQDYEKYLLTIMNMVSDFYHDASIGNQIDVVVVRIIYLEKEEEELDLSITPDSNGTLISFNAWANKMNPKELSHPNHYDVAILITRHDICNEFACTVLGLAYIASICDPTKSAAVCEDAGLVLGVVVAHEIGHMMGCAHDEESVSGCPAKDKGEMNFLMSPISSLYCSRWSNCSKQYITTLLNSGLGECLNNNPKDPSEKYKFPTMLPGAMYDADTQCKLKFPDTTQFCGFGKGINCKSLWCKQEARCYSNYQPPADGTKCGEQKWCIKKKCVDMGTRPEAIHGGWGKWGSQSKCSRTCGGGITITERECDNPQPSNGGKYCIGERRKINMCNTQPCSIHEPSFRAIQCAEFNKVNLPVDGYRKWIPFFQSGFDPCLLYCLSDENIISNLAKAKDATPCKSGTNNICFSGICQKVGCDWVVDSRAIEDKCGDCKGGGTNCKLIQGQYTAVFDSGFKKIVTVPKGARNILLFEHEPTPNLLAVKLEKDNTYCLSGKLKEFGSAEYPCAGALIIYSNPELEREVVEIKGPIQEDIQLQYAFYHHPNFGITYEYYVRSTVNSGYTPKYLWDYELWSSCDVICGGGTMISQPVCIEQQNGVVFDDFCKNITPPEPLTRICNKKPCPTKWRVSQWSDCSACTGSIGERTRTVQCVKTPPHVGEEDYQVDLYDCLRYYRKPIELEPCFGEKPCKKKSRKVSRRSYERDDTSFDIQEFAEDMKRLNQLLDVGLASYVENLEGKDLERDQVLKDKKKPRDQTDKWLLNEEKRIYDKQNDKLKRAENIQMKTLSTLKPGSIVKDYYPSENSVLLEAPFKADTFKANLSDVAFREGDDSVPAEIDTSQQKIYHGIEAQRRINEMTNPNATGSPK